MKFIALTAIAVAVCTSFSCLADIKVSAQAKEIAKKYPLVDTHVDVPYRLEDQWDDVSKATSSGDFDYPRSLSGGLDAPFMSIYIPARYEEEGGGIALANQLIDRVEAIVGRAPDKFALAYRADDIEKNFKAGLISLPMGMENGTPIEGDFKNLQHFYNRGIRYITLAHSKSNHICDSSYDDNKQWQGLSPFGKKLISEMNNIGMMIDISHVSDEAFAQVIALTKTPVIASHSSLRHFTPGFERNMSDEMVKQLKANGGVIQINFGSSFISEAANQYGGKVRAAAAEFMQANNITEQSDEKVKAFVEQYKQDNPYPYATLADVVAHIDRVVELVGIDHVGIGSDYDGVGDSLPTDLKDVASFPNLIQALLDKGYSEADIKKIMSDNILRVWRQVEAYAAAH